jgi:hypothetical protein
VGVIGQPLDRALSAGIGPEQVVSAQQKEKGAQAVRIDQLRHREALAVALPPVGAVEANLDEVPASRVSLVIPCGGSCRRTDSLLGD